ncbi:hypothetical protein ACJBV1_11340, partial [Streptococcus suis]
CSPGKLLESRWYEGPTWLYDEKDWPKTDEDPDENLVASELKKTAIVKTTHQVGQPIFNTKFRSWMKTVRVLAYVK